MLKRVLLAAVLLGGFLVVRPVPALVLEHTPVESPFLSAQAVDQCPPLSPASGDTVSSTTALITAVNTASPGDTILIADGMYPFVYGQYLRVEVDGVTIRSASGNRDAVVLDGNYDATELIQIVASNVTIAALTLREAYDHPIHIMSTSSSDTLNTRIYDVHIIDPGQQAIKINPYQQENALYFIDDGEIACSHIELTDAGRPHIRDNCYTGGVDAHQAMGWTIRDNVIEGFWCSTGLSEHAIHMWKSCRDTVVERNTLRNNARGVGFGMDSYNSNLRTYSPDPCPSAGGGYVDHYGGIIRNNAISADDSDLFSSPDGFDCGICLWQACDAQAIHNTVYTANTLRTFSSIEWRFGNTVAEITNNLVNYSMMERDEASATQTGNVTNAQSTWFVDASNGDLHLLPTATAAIDQGATVAAGRCDDDMDGDARPIGSARDVGADEYGIAAPAAVTDLRVADVVTATNTVTVTLTWSAPSGALTTTLRYDGSPIIPDTWAGAMLITDVLSGTTEIYTETLGYEGGTLFFALRTENEGGVSPLSNNAFWPRTDVFLPAVLRAY